MTKTVGKLSLALLSLTMLAVAQEKKAANPEVPRYDVAAQQTITGSIQEIKDYKCPVTGSIGTHLAIKTLAGTLEAHLAPASFLKNYGIEFKQWQDVKIIGVKVTFDGKPAVLVRQLTVANETYTFRDEKGRPLW